MDAQKVLSVLDIYAQELPKYNFDGEHPHSERADPSRRYLTHSGHYWLKKLNHLLWAVEQCRGLVGEGKMEKAFRWLGFIQGAMWFEGIFSIDELRSHNAPAGEPLDVDRSRG